MTHDEKINYLRIAAGICGYSFTNEGLDLLISLYDLVLGKEGASTIDNIVEVELEVKERANVKKRSELLDKVSKKKK